jgi:hypothetical protein
MADPKHMAMLFLKAHGHAEPEPDGDEASAATAEPPAPDDHRHEGDQIMREHLDAVHSNDHQAAHDAMAAMIDHHMAQKMMKK